MKNKVRNRKLNHQCFTILIVFCIVLVLFLLFSPKLNVFFSDDNSSYLDKENVKYRLIYSKEYTTYDRNAALISKTNDNQLVDGYLKKVVSQYKDENVYFRVKVSPVIFLEEKQQEGYSEEKRQELFKQRIEYVKEIGANDMALVPNTSYSYYASLDVEMINKIEEKRDCFLYLAAVPNPNDYPDAEDNIIIINVTEGMEIPL